MIAVFCRYEKDFRNMNPTPKSEFIRIRKVHDISGIKFTGVIMYLDWYDANRKAIDAYEILRGRQPELFEQ